MSTSVPERHALLDACPGEGQSHLVRTVARAEFLLRVAKALAAMQTPHRALDSLVSLLLDELVDVAHVVVRVGSWQGSSAGVRGAEVRSWSGHWLDATPQGLEEALRRGASRSVVLPAAGTERREAIASFFLDPDTVEAVDRLGTTGLLVLPLHARGAQLGLVVLARQPGAGVSDCDDFLVDLAEQMAMGLDATLTVAESRYVAGVLRRSLAPADLPEVPHLDLATFYRVAHQSESVGGDFFDVHGAPDDLTVVCGDVAGKGVEAAVDAKRIRNAVRTASMIDRSPGWILRLVNRVMVAEAAGFSERLATATCLRLRADGDRVRADVANAGHPPAFLLRADGRVEEVVAGGVALALLEDSTYAETTVSLEPGDTLVLYTDGVTEARGREDLYGEERLRAHLSRMGGLPATAVVESVAVAVSEHLGEREHDDIAIVAAQFRPDEA